MLLFGQASEEVETLHKKASTPRGGGQQQLVCLKNSFKGQECRKKRSMNYSYNWLIRGVCLDRKLFEIITATHVTL